MDESAPTFLVYFFFLHFSTSRSREEAKHSLDSSPGLSLAPGAARAVECLFAANLTRLNGLHGFSEQATGGHAIASAAAGNDFFFSAFLPMNEQRDHRKGRDGMRGGERAFA